VGATQGHDAVLLGCAQARISSPSLGLMDEGISLYETTRGSLKPDSFILSAAFHLYEHAGRESEAQDVLDAISVSGTSFLRNMKIGSKL